MQLTSAQVRGMHAAAAARGSAVAYVEHALGGLDDAAACAAILGALRLRVENVLEHGVADRGLDWREIQNLGHQIAQLADQIERAQRGRPVALLPAPGPLAWRA